MLAFPSLAYLPLVGIGTEVKVANCDLALVEDTRGDAGDELQVIHPLYLFGPFSIPVASSTFFLIEREALQRKSGQIVYFPT